MAPHPVDVLLARAQSHLAEARLPQAVGAFRAAVGVAGTCPKVVPAQLGLAAALSALGRRQEAVEGLSSAAEVASGRGEHAEAMRLWTEALAIDPSRTELHLDLAMTEQALGRHAEAVTRLEGLADRYMDEGRYDDAAELLRCVSEWADDDGGMAAAAPVERIEHVEAVEPVEPVEPVAPALDLVPRHAALITGDTVIARNPLLHHTALITGDTVIARNPLLPGLDVRPAVATPAAALRSDEVTRVDAPLMMVPAAAEADAAHEAEGFESRITVVHGGAARAQAPARRPALRPVVGGSEVVERLKARAGLGRHAATPRRASVRTTEPIAIRSRPRFTAQDEDVTRYFRRPQGLSAAS